MKPLTSSSVTTLLQRIDSAKGGEIRSITVISPTTMQLRMSIQDQQRGFDWIDIIVEVGGIYDAKLIEDSKLPFVDLEHGISMIANSEASGIGLGHYTSITSLKDSNLYLLGSSIKYAEAEFSG